MECHLENITIHYETFGQGRPIVMLHGLPADHLSCMTLLEPIFKQRSGWKRFYPDLPGMGRTRGMDWITEQDDVLKVVLNFIGSVVPGQTVSLAGYSYGAYLVQAVVYQKPALVNGVFLVAPYTGYILADESVRPLPQHITLVEDKALIEELEPDEAAMFQSTCVVQSRRTLDEFKDWFRRAMKMADQEYLSRLEGNFALSFDVRVLPEPFDRPALIVAGRQDSVLGYRDAWDILENYPRATLAVLDRAGHSLPCEQEHLLHTLIDEWLYRVEENTSS